MKNCECCAKCKINLGRGTHYCPVINSYLHRDFSAERKNGIMPPLVPDENADKCPGLFDPCEKENLR